MNKTSIVRILDNPYFHYALLFLTVVIIWQIFYPGLLSPDSLAQYDQGKSGYYVDWHPPLMAIILRFVIKLGGDIGLLIFFQCLAAIFGIRCIILQLLKFYSRDFSNKPFYRLTSTLLTFFFLIPFLSPYLLFSVMFWTDAWLTIFLLWVVAYFLWLFLNLEKLSEREFIIQIVLFSISSALMVLIRHNSIVMMPAICLILAIISKNKLGKKGLFAFALPLLLVLVLNTSIYTFFNVNRTYAGNQVLASDLTIMLRLYPELAYKYPLTNRHKDSPTVLLTPNGGLWNETIEGKPCPVLNKKICDPKMPLSCFGFKDNTFGVDDNDCYSPVGTDNKVLKDEYFKALTNNPIELFGAKLYLFGQIINSDNWRTNRINCEISKNNSGLELNSNFTGIRNNLCYLNDQFANNWYFYWFFGVHLLWLLLNLVFLVYFGIKFIYLRNINSIITFLVFLIPLSYYLSYLLAATTPDYRFMYPSTLMMQILTVTFITTKFTFSKKSD